MIAHFVPQSFTNQNAWRDDLWLITPEEYGYLADGIELTSISGKKAVKGFDYVDQDTGFGYLAYGLYSTQFPQ